MYNKYGCHIYSLKILSFLVNRDVYREWRLCSFQNCVNNVFYHKEKKSI